MWAIFTELNPIYLIIYLFNPSNTTPFTLSSISSTHQTKLINLIIYLFNTLNKTPSTSQFLPTHNPINLIIYLFNPPNKNHKPYHQSLQPTKQNPINLAIYLFNQLRILVYCYSICEQFPINLFFVFLYFSHRYPWILQLTFTYLKWCLTNEKNHKLRYNPPTFNIQPLTFRLVIKLSWLGPIHNRKWDVERPFVFSCI